MPKHIPALCIHKATGQAYVRLNGEQVYLGKHSTEATEQRYRKTIAEWMANNCRPLVKESNLAVTELLSAYLDHAESHYVDSGGRPTSTLSNVQTALRDTHRLYGSTMAADFGPKALKAVRASWVDQGLSRNTVNQYTSIVKRGFKWAVAEEMIPFAVYQPLSTVEGLRRGRSAAKESRKVGPVDTASIDAVKPLVSRQIWALIQLQRFTGARGGELLRLRAVDIDVKEDVWKARISGHKTDYRDGSDGQARPRILYFGPRAQTVLREFMQDRSVDAYLFSPREAIAEAALRANGHRRGNQPASPRKTSRRVGEVYTASSYRQAIRRACESDGIPKWTPHQLRHTAATEIRERFGLDRAQVILGHSSAKVTEVYAELDAEKAIAVAREIG